MDKSCLRFRVLAARCKVEGGRVKEGVVEGRVSERRWYKSMMKLV